MMVPGLRFYIKLDEKDKFRQWNPGDRITGSVRLSTSAELNIHQVSISFTGKSSSKLTVTTETTPCEYHGHVTLFDLQTIFIRSPYTFPADSRERWPFEFTVPPTCAAKAGDSFEPHGSFLEPYDDDPAQPLPPTFADARAAAYEGRTTKCSVKYALCAFLYTKRPGSLHRDDKVHELPLRVLPFRPDPEPVWTTHCVRTAFQFRSLLLSAEGADEAPTFGQRVRARLLADALPVAAFDVVATLPKVSTPGHMLPVTLEVDHDGPGSTVQTPPAVSLREFRLGITAKTQQATKGGAKGTEDDWTEPWEGEEDVAVWKGDVAISEQLELHKVAKHGLVLPDHLTPTFNTFNVSRCYSLKLGATIECAKERRKFECVIRDFCVLSPKLEK